LEIQSLGKSLSKLPIKIGIIVEARLTSSRLPEKHLLLAAGEPILKHMLDRLKKLNGIEQIILAIPDNDENMRLAELGDAEGVDVFRGSEQNVMKRVLQAAQEFELDAVCEITGDCPIIDINLTQKAIDFFLENNYDYISNGRTGLPDGMGCQIFRTYSLEQSFASTTKNEHLEHVTLHIKENPHLFSQYLLPTDREIYNPDLRLTLDNEEDYFLIRNLIEHFHPENPLFSLPEILKYLNLNLQVFKSD
jgi:spore coat polysaccharide biosynthesis protein SpsF